MIVYGLRDPRDGKMRYVGCTSNFEARIRAHYCRAGYNITKSRRVWIDELLKAGLKPEPVFLELVRKKDAGDAERKWISHYGMDLLNRFGAMNDRGTTS